MAAPSPQDTDENFEKLLTSSLQRIIDFLKYAEAKNAALLTFSSAWILAILNMVNKDALLPGLVWYLYTALPCFMVAGLLALASFFPRISLPGFLGGRRAGPHPNNLLFFGDIANLTFSEFKIALRARYAAASGQVSDTYLDDLMTQIAVNSQITRMKLQLFQVGLWFVVLAAMAFIYRVFPLLVSQFRTPV